MVPPHQAKGCPTPEIPTSTWQAPFTTSEKPIVGIVHPGLRPRLEDFRADLAVDELNAAHRWLKIVGSLGNVSPLHHQRVILRTIIPSESARLHLVWFNRTIYVKPLPDMLLDSDYWTEVIGKDETKTLYPLMTGFVRSYCSLIKSPIDLSIAQELHLISKVVEWEKWALFRENFMDQLEKPDHPVNPRYQYGELRLNRLNLIWRVQGRGLTYFTVHRQYDTYFKQYLALFITAFGVVATVLTAMQVILTMNQTELSPLLIAVCYRFSIVALFGVLACFAYVALVFLAMFGYNATITACAHRNNAGSNSNP